MYNHNTRPDLTLGLIIFHAKRQTLKRPCGMQATVVWAQQQATDPGGGAPRPRIGAAWTSAHDRIRVDFGVLCHDMGRIGQ
jgi:hypothetical protein